MLTTELHKIKQKFCHFNRNKTTNKAKNESGSQKKNKVTRLIKRLLRKDRQKGDDDDIDDYNRKKAGFKRNGMCRFFYSFFFLLLSVCHYCITVKSVIKTMTLNYFMRASILYCAAFNIDMKY